MQIQGRQNWDNSHKYNSIREVNYFNEPGVNSSMHRIPRWKKSKRMTREQTDVYFPRLYGRYNLPSRMCMCKDQQNENVVDAIWLNLRREFTYGA